MWTSQSQASSPLSLAELTASHTFKAEEEGQLGVGEYLSPWMNQNHGVVEVLKLSGSSVPS